MYTSALNTVYPLSSQSKIIAKPILREDTVSKLVRLKQGVIPIYKPGDMLYDLSSGKTGYPFNTSASIYSPQPLK